jgi:uncharacterized tellurite resistance protein B-like protein
MFDKKFLKDLAKSTIHVGKEIAKDTIHVSKEIAKGTIHVSSEIAKSTIHVGNEISKEAANVFGGNESRDWDLAKLPEEQRLAFYGALFAIASADGHLDKDEMDLIYGFMDLDGMSDHAKEQVQEYIIDPPNLADCLKVLSSADDTLRYGVMINMVDTALADDDLDPQESKALASAQAELKISHEQRQAIDNFVQKTREIRARGLDDNQATDAIKTATAGLSAVGVPIAAVYFSGSVIGLSAAGITSGLAAIGLGFGMVPGIGIAVLIGAGIFMGVSQLLDVGGQQEKERLMAERERKAQLVIENLQGALNKLVERVANLQTVAADAEASKEAIRVLTEKMRYLQQLVAKRKQASGQPV